MIPPGSVPAGGILAIAPMAWLQGIMSYGRPDSRRIQSADPADFGDPY